MEHTYYVSCSMEQCGDLIHSAIVDGSITGELLDHYVVKGPNGLKCAVMVYEKHYWRVGNRLTLTVTIDNMSAHTRVHIIGGGGGGGLIRFDWGAAESFEDVVEEALRPYAL